MKTTYDPDADAMYIKVKEGKIAGTRQIDENVIIDVDKEGCILGVEVLFVKERVPELLKDLKCEKQVGV